MSQPLRDYLTVLVRRHIELRAQPVPAFAADNTKSEEENLDNLIIVVAEAELLCRNLTENRERLEHSWEEYSALLKRITVNERIAETPVYRQFATDNSLEDVVAEAGTRVDELALALIRLRGRENALRRSIAQRAPVAPVAGAGAAAAVPAGRRRPKPKILEEITPFTGEKIEDWMEFWEDFQDSVHNDPDYSPIEKFKLLRFYVKEPAKNLIKGLSLTLDDYNTAIDVLQEKYGSKDLLLESLDQELFALKPAYNLAQCKELYDKFDLLCRQMENCGVNVSTNTQIWRSLLIKLSKPIMSKVLEKKSSHVLWTTDEMRST